MLELKCNEKGTILYLLKTHKVLSTRCCDCQFVSLDQGVQLLVDGGGFRGVVVVD